MLEQANAIRHFNSRMEQMASLPLNEETDAEGWDAACEDILGELKAKFPDFELEPHLQALVAIPHESTSLEARQRQQAAVHDYVVAQERICNPNTTIPRPSLVRVTVVVGLPVLSAILAIPISVKMGSSESDWLGLGIVFRAGVIFFIGCGLGASYWLATKDDSH